MVIALPVGLHREHGAALHGPAVEEHGAGAALAGVAADVGAREVELVAQHVNQQRRGSTSTVRAEPLMVRVTERFMEPRTPWLRGGGDVRGHGSLGHKVVFPGVGVKVPLRALTALPLPCKVTVPVDHDLGV